MTTLEHLKQEIASALAKALGGDIAVSAAELVRPPNPEMGDLAFGCFAAAKALKKSPAEIAKTAAAAFPKTEFVRAAQALGPYVNLTLDRPMFAASVMREVLSMGRKYGASPKKDERVMIEYAQPNTHKEVHVGHLRNMCLGLSVVNLTRAAGYDVVAVSYMGDIGAHVAKCLWCLKKFHADEPIPENKGKYLGQIYAEATRRVEEDESLKEEVAAVQRKLEAREPEWDALWQETRQWSLDEFAAIFRELGVELDRDYFESEVEEPGKQLARELLAKGIAETGEKGALIVNLEKYGLGIFLVLKSDGSSLYSTKELALAGLKFKEYPGITKSIHVVDSRQSLYFQQLFKTLELMGFDKKMVHLAYEFVTLKEGAMSSRKGNIIAYEDFRDEVTARAAAETQKRRADWTDEHVAEAARVIAEGAMKFGMLRQDPDKPIVFDIESSLAFEGFTGPYVQYAHVRLSSILRKAADSGEAEQQLSGSEDEREFRLLRTAADFPEVVAAAAEHHKPSVLAQYLFEFAQQSNDFYRDVPVLAADPADRGRRLAVTRAARTVLAAGLALLGIHAPEEM